MNPTYIKCVTRVQLLQNKEQKLQQCSIVKTTRLQLQKSTSSFCQFYLVFIPLTERVVLGEKVILGLPNGIPASPIWYDPESDSTRSQMIMLQFPWLRSGSNSDTRPLNPDWTFLLVRNMMSESPHLCLSGSHLYQITFLGLKTWSVVKEHGITTQSPASAGISASLRVAQSPIIQSCLLKLNSPV